jgi:glutamate-1-semialdehyde 2,1-aminomutase
MVTLSQDLFTEAQKYIPGGVNSPVRAFRAVGGQPLFIKKAQGSKIYDADGREYIDYVGSWGPLILGHSHPQIIQRLKEAIEYGTSYGAPTELEVELARMIVRAVPSIDLVRLVNSGTEAVMSAIRLARAYTGRDKIIKFEGCYHGHADSLLVKAGSGATTLGIPDSPGIPHELAKLTITLPYNDLEAVERVLASEGEAIACIIVEPIAGNMGLIPPAEGFLAGLRSLTTEYGIVLIFDEVITGFRVNYGGAQNLYGIYPDLTCLGKIIGGGLPVGAYGGKKIIMELVAPSGPVYQAGTLSGNPLAMVAGIETLKILSQRGIYQELEEKSETLCAGLRRNVEQTGIPIWMTHVGSLFCCFFHPGPLSNYQQVKQCNTEKYGQYFQRMLSEGIYLAPSQFECSFVSLAHSADDIEKTLNSQLRALQALQKI